MSAKRDLGFEDALSEDWSRDLDLKEVPLDRGPVLAAGIILLAIAATVGGRVFFLTATNGALYEARAERNRNAVEHISAPRGIITDRFGTPIADNTPSFSLLLHVREFVNDETLQEETFRVLREIVGISREETIAELGEARQSESLEPVVIAGDLTQEQVVELKALNLPSLSVVDGIERQYKDPSAFASLVGYIGFPTAADLKIKEGKITPQDLTGKAGIEAFYDDILRGTAGSRVTIRNAKGEVVEPTKETPPTIGESLTLSIDAGLQTYFAHRLKEGLDSLGRVSGVGLAIDPRNGEVLALVNLPSFDNNILSRPGHREEKTRILTSSAKPLFSRAVSGLYNPGSTIKPLVGVAALAEQVIDPKDEIFSPGYLDIPNPYNPDKPTRYVDWRYQGNVNLAAAIAQSSNVYFYVVGGGGNGRRGLGITGLRGWWERFMLGSRTGIDFPGEAEGFLPSPEWKEKTTKRPWLLGDTYNVSIGQGDLLVTPIQLISYIGAIANGGVIYKPTLNKQLFTGEIRADLSGFADEIGEVRQGMRRAVTSELGGSRIMKDLPIEVAGKTGTAQIENNKKVNAFFVGYAPYKDPKIAILVLVEDSREGSLNALPVAKDVFAWYYEHRLK